MSHHQTSARDEAGYMRPDRRPPQRHGPGYMRPGEMPRQRSGAGWMDPTTIAALARQGRLV